MLIKKMRVLDKRESTFLTNIRKRKAVDYWCSVESAH